MKRTEFRFGLNVDVNKCQSMKELLCVINININSIQQIPQLEMIHYTEHTDSVRRPDVLQRSRLNNKKVIIVITTD